MVIVDVVDGEWVLESMTAVDEFELHFWWQSELSREGERRTNKQTQ